MIINIINGSQKTGESNTGLILDYLNNLIKEKHKVKLFYSGIKTFTDDIFDEIISGDVIILAFPLFGDYIPSNTLKMLVELEEKIKYKQKHLQSFSFASATAKKLIMYLIVNNGFYEGKQNHIAFEVIKNWCDHSGVQFGGGIGQGAGEMIGQTKQFPLNKGPFNNLARTLQKMADNIEFKMPMEIIYLSPYFPKLLWIFMAERHWHSLARNNKLNKKDIRKKIIP